MSPPFGTLFYACGTDAGAKTARRIFMPPRYRVFGHDIDNQIGSDNGAGAEQGGQNDRAFGGPAGDALHGNGGADELIGEEGPDLARAVPARTPAMLKAKAAVSCS